MQRSLSLSTLILGLHPSLVAICSDTDSQLLPSARGGAVKGYSDGADDDPPRSHPKKLTTEPPH